MRPVLSGWQIAAVACAAAAGAVLVGRRPDAAMRQRLGLARPHGSGRPALHRGRLLRMAGVAALTVGVLHQSQAVAVGVVVALFAVGLGGIRRRAMARKAAAGRRAAVLEVCDQMAAELRAGQPPPRALQHAAAAWTDLEPAASAARLGGDVPEALRAAGRRPGAESLSAVAAAWQVAQRSGAGLAAVLDRTAEALRVEDATRREVVAALGPPRATARLLALLPLFGLLLGTGIGADPWGFLVGTPVGVGCLAVGCGLGLAGLTWVERLADAAERST